jgi:hypothetical protein
MAYAYIVLDPDLFFLSATISVWVCGYTKNIGLVNLIQQVSKMSSRAGEMRLFLKK